MLICFRHGFEATLDALAVGFELLLVAEGELDGGASVVVGVADAPLEVALVAPVDELEVAAVDNKPWWVGVCLDDVAQLGVGVLEASWWVLLHRALQEVVEGARGGLLLAMSGDAKGKVESFRHILARNGTGEDEWCPRCEVELGGDLRGRM